jgi:hypothetical protein
MKEMETNKLKEQAEDIQPIENEEISTTEELTPEQREQQEKFFLSIIRAQNKSILRALQAQIKKGKTLEEILQEIEEKRSSLSANQRLFVQSFKLDFIQKLLEV